MQSGGTSYLISLGCQSKALQNIHSNSTLVVLYSPLYK